VSDTPTIDFAWEQLSASAFGRVVDGSTDMLFVYLAAAKVIDDQLNSPNGVSGVNEADITRLTGLVGPRASETLSMLALSGFLHSSFADGSLSELSYRFPETAYNR
jgi:hypothetical protein